MSDEQPQDPGNRVPTGVELTPPAPAFRADPYPILARLREREPVHHDDVITRWVLTPGNDADRVLRDRTMAVDGRKANEGTSMRMFAVPVCRLVEGRRQPDAYLERAIAERRAHPRDDLISAMIAVEEADDQLNDAEIVTMCGLLLAAGNLPPARYRARPRPAG